MYQVQGKRMRRSRTTAKNLQGGERVRETLIQNWLQGLSVNRCL